MITLQVIVLILMTSTILYLFHLLRKQQAILNRESGDQKDQFRKEKRNLFIVLIIFDLSYALRALYESLVVRHFEQYMFIYSICNITVDALPDLVPISLILVLHYRNFVKR